MEATITVICTYHNTPVCRRRQPLHVFNTI